MNPLRVNGGVHGSSEEPQPWRQTLVQYHEGKTTLEGKKLHTNMAARLKENLPQEGTSGESVGESLSEHSSGCPTYSGGGKELQHHTEKPTTKTTLVQQTFHRSMFNITRSNSLGTTPTETQTNSTIKEADKEWQQDRVPTIKRKRVETSPTTQHLENPSKKPQTDNITIAVPTQNQFDILAQDIDNINDELVKPPKPEPIFVTGVKDISKLKDILNAITKTEDYTMTTLRSGHVVKLMPFDVDVYKTIRQHFVAENVSHFTYQLKSERAYRVVLRGLHPSEDIKNISMEIEKLGHEVRQTVQVLHRVTKNPLPVFYVDLEPKHNNKDIFKVKQLNHMKVTFEAPYKKKEIVQCKRCQRFGHSKNQCFRPFRCVKCGEEHSTALCKKSRDTDATCANCSEKHPASYKGCTKYKQYREQILKISHKSKESHTSNMGLGTQPQKSDNRRKTYQRAQESQQHKQNTGNPAHSLAIEDFPPLYHKYRTDNTNNTTPTLNSHTTKTAKQGNSYASKVISQATADSSLPGSTDLEVIMEKMLHRFQNIMTDMIDKMMDRMFQLFSSLLKK